MKFTRHLNLLNLLDNKSFFLFGPRSTGKTSLINSQLKGSIIYDLLDAETFSRLARRPKIIEEKYLSDVDNNIIVIDEIQKLPEILDEVHRLLNKYHLRFLLTGSSARKLRRGGVNLLAGRAWQAELFPLIYREIPDFDLLLYLNAGGLPHVYGNPMAKEELRSYVHTYLQEEIHNEALTKKLSSFTQLLDLIALSNGKEINFQSLASDCGVSAVTLKNYIEILSDTLIGFVLPGYVKTKKRKAISRGKFYFFDIGVANTLSRAGEIYSGSALFGNSFEHFILLEVRAWNSYERKFHELTYWRSTTKFEVDLVIGDELALEIKSTELIQDKHLKGLRAFKEEGLVKEYMVVSQDQEERTTSDGIRILPWKKFLEKLWGDEIIGAG
jgi:predicted AAA+ superfamily ATPase